MALGWRSDHSLRVVGWSLAALSVLLVATVPLSMSGGVSTRPRVVETLQPGDWLDFFVILAFAFSGAGLIHARPRNAIGWLLLACGVLQAIQVSAQAYATRALTDPDGSLTLGLASMWLASWTWMPAVILPVVVLPAIYPTGHAPNRFWMWHVRICLLGLGLLIVLVATIQDGVDDVVAGTRLPWDMPRWWAPVVGLPAAAIVGAGAAIALVGTVVRALRARAPERQQLVWLVCVAGSMAATVFLPVELVFGLAYGCVPVAIVVGVLRYRLLGIEMVMRRTLLYVPLTVLVALTIGGLTTVLARLAPEGPLPLLIASGVVAVLVLPIAGRLRKWVDRFVLGERADPLAVVDRLGAGLEGSADNPVPSMLEAVASAVGATYAAVLDDRGRQLAFVGELRGGCVELPLRHGGLMLGTLCMGPRRGEQQVTERDVRLLEVLARHLAVVIRSAQLTNQLAAERERVVTATQQERERLRRDLHDGLGPSLSGIALGIEAADHALAADPVLARDLMTRTRVEAERAVQEIRRVLDGLRPTALDRHGLAGAVEHTAAALGLGQAGSPSFDLSAGDVSTLPPHVEEAAFRIIAESLTNVARHSGAQHCHVTLEQVNGDLRLDVADDGAGVALARADGVGLESMRCRAADLGGTVTVSARHPHGTAVSATLPLEHP